MVLKENVAKVEKQFDDEDHSWTRPLTDLYKLFNEAQVDVVLDKRQRNLPKGMFEVRMFALKPKVQKL